MVAGELGSPKRKSNPPSTSGNDNLLRCSKIGRMGGGLSPEVDGRPMDNAGDVLEHKRSRTDCCRIGHQNLHKGKETEIHSYQDRQHVGLVLHCKDGGARETGIC